MIGLSVMKQFTAGTFGFLWNILQKSMLRVVHWYRKSSIIGLCPTAHKMKFPIKDFFNRFDRIRSFISLCKIRVLYASVTQHFHIYLITINLDVNRSSWCVSDGMLRLSENLKAFIRRICMKKFFWEIFQNIGCSLQLY